jgi:hypothetical protein
VPYGLLSNGVTVGSDAARVHSLCLELRVIEEESFASAGHASCGLTRQHAESCGHVT